MAVHNEGHLRKSGHELGGSDHHRLFLVLADGVQIGFLLLLLLLLFQYGTVLKIVDQIADQGYYLLECSDHLLAETSTRVQLIGGMLQVQMSFNRVIIFVRKDRHFIHHKEGVCSSEVIPVVGDGRRSLPLEANKDLRLGVQMTVHGAEQLVGELHLPGVQHVPVGDAHLAQILTSGLFFSVEFSLQVDGQCLQVVVQHFRRQLMKIFRKAVVVVYGY